MGDEMRKLLLVGFLVFPALLGCLLSCRGGTTKKGPDKQESSEIFLQVTNRKPLFCGTFDLHGEPRILGVFQKQGEFRGEDVVISSLRRFAGNWQEVSQSVAEHDAEGQELQNDFEIVEIEGETYLYFSRQLIHYGTAYNGLGFVEFLLYSPSEKRLIKLEFSGRGEEPPIEGNFDNLSDLSSQPELLKFLEGKAASSPLIARTDPKSLDIDNVTQYDKKWLRENPDAYAAKTGGSLTFCYYQEDLFTKFSGTQSERVETQKYVVSTSFAGPVLGYDKATGKYMVIWIPEGMGAGGAWGLRTFHAHFRDDSTLIIKSELETIEIDLQRGRFSVISRE
jgi:hypothetical protein